MVIGAGQPGLSAAYPLKKGNASSHDAALTDTIEAKRDAEVVQANVARAQAALRDLRAIGAP
ncbi:hypothetical protein DEIPH_ctg139orf0081 [Deinococcus phoenicis]|uniref:Uncharacterized protein n=1 Tax=Deinococcus phoenicis TaxID=1476583 RepID=A0A016QJW1_9DEIO|nr:hypothetical protein [Deinococcus phoenicis]EYB66358.1 hypothetical protein DEIPH_ctg139orf0081 [Deinococcus phoenicis]